MPRRRWVEDTVTALIDHMGRNESASMVTSITQASRVATGVCGSAPCGS